MEVNKADLLKNIQNFIGAENDLAIKEAQHQIGIFKAVYEQEIEAYEKLEEKGDATHPKEEETNAAILKAIEAFEKNEAKKTEENTERLGIGLYFIQGENQNYKNKN